ncbi:CatB-related O-acetyltransferase [Mesorhizobium sp. ANAO-SY3R2]|uniref:CatB-related O-acetyltransferase n=1 Tax=Mesorhizobium sp. ANAO-SY3R2 TaxID=3166644 RepID=UPI00366D5FFF
MRGVSTFPFKTEITKELPNMEGLLPSRPMQIGNDVWIGRRATIMPGVTVGDGAVIGTGSIVTKDVKPYEVVAGNPAKHIRFRFPREQIDQLLAIRWWEWSDQKIQTEQPSFHGPVGNFIERHLGQVSGCSSVGHSATAD